MFSVGTGVPERASSAVAAAPAKYKPERAYERPPALTRRKQKLILSLAVFAVTLVFYNPISHDGFVLLDDVPYILNNPAVKAGLTWSTVKWAFTTFHAGYWHPLTWLSHALDCQMFGLNPAGHHYVSLLIHAGNAVLLFLLLEEATALAWPSVIVAAIFAVHPVNVESVAWAAERKNVLSMFFFLLALLIYGRYARRGGAWRYLGVNACFLLGMMAKPQIITLPFVLLLWDYWPLNRISARKLAPSQSQQSSNQRRPGFLLLEKFPLMAIMLAGAVLTFYAQRSAGAVQTLADFSLQARLKNVLVSYARYLGMLVWPRHLAPIYPHAGSGIPAWQLALSVLTLLGISLIVLWRSEQRYLTVGWLWFLGVLVPMIGIVQVGEQAMADRFVYIPMIGVLFASVWAAWEFFDRHAFAKAWLALPALVSVFALGGVTHHQLGYWKDGETLWRYTLTVTDDNYMAHDNLAMVLNQQGRVPEAIPEFIKAESLHAYPLPQVFGMGVYLQQNGDAPDAMKMFAKVANRAADPEMRSMAWTQMGAASAQLQRYDEAAGDYQQALRIDPGNAAALVGSALLAERSGEMDQAMAQLDRATKIEPGDLTLLMLADALRGAGRMAEAKQAEQAAQRISSDMTRAREKTTAAEAVFGLAPNGVR